MKLLDGVNASDACHKQCYSTFTFLMAMYRNLCVNNSPSITDVPRTSCTSSSQSNSSINAHESTLVDGTPILEMNSSIIDNSDLNTHDINLLIESFNEKQA